MAYDEELADRIREAAGEAPLAEKRMFGGLAFLVNGNMAIAAGSGGGVLVRVDPARTAAYLRSAHARPMVMRGRPVDGWVRVDGDGVRSMADLRRWVERGLAFARSLPPK